ncbi:MAG: phosphatidylglycerophosphatase A [Planctomycetes bacterium]|nr:phosphatidylglycerophosphatase A [Planctomycetota bacterium]
MNQSPSPSNPASGGNLGGRLALFLATGFGVGLIPFAPGTWGSLLGLPLAWLMQQLPTWVQWGTPAFCFLIGAPLCGIGARQLGKEDPGAVVLDEIAAFSVVFLCVPLTSTSAVVGFALFRLFDITKPWPAKRLEHLPGGWGIMADDYAAGAYAGGLLWLIAHWWPLG